MRVPVPSALPWSSVDCNDQQGVCPAPSAALGVNQRLSNTVLPQFSRIPAHPPGQGTGYLGTDPHRSSWTDCLSLGQLVQSPVVSSSTQSSPAPRSSLLGTVLSALGMQSTEVKEVRQQTMRLPSRECSKQKEQPASRQALKQEHCPRSAGQVRLARLGQQRQGKRRRSAV